MCIAELEDDTGIVRLEFWGRRSVAGLHLGTDLTADGTMAQLGDRLRILNPLVEIHAADETIRLIGVTSSGLAAY